MQQSCVGDSCVFGGVVGALWRKLTHQQHMPWETHMLSVWDSAACPHLHSFTHTHITTAVALEPLLTCYTAHWVHLWSLVARCWGWELLDTPTTYACISSSSFGHVTAVNTLTDVRPGWRVCVFTGYFYCGETQATVPDIHLAHEGESVWGRQLQEPHASHVCNPGSQWTQLPSEESRCRSCV